MSDRSFYKRVFILRIYFRERFFFLEKITPKDSFWELYMVWSARPNSRDCKNVLGKNEPQNTNPPFLGGPLLNRSCFCLFFLLLQLFLFYLPDTLTLCVYQVQQASLSPWPFLLGDSFTAFHISPFFSFTLSVSPSSQIAFLSPPTLARTFNKMKN